MLRFLIGLLALGAALGLVRTAPPVPPAPAALPPLIDLAHIPLHPPESAPALLALGPLWRPAPAAPESVTTYLGLGAMVVTPTARLPVAGAGFSPGDFVTLYDNGALITSGTATAGGFFSTMLTAPAVPGYHALYAVDSAGHSAVAAYTVVTGGADGPMFALAPAWAGPGTTIALVWAGFPPNISLLLRIDGTCPPPGCYTVPTGSGEGMVTTTAPATPAAYVYSLSNGYLTPSQVVQVNYPAPAYASGTNPRLASNVPGGWGAVGEGFQAGETVRLLLNGSGIGDTAANATGVALVAFAPHAVGDGQVEKLTMIGQASGRRAYAATYFFMQDAPPPGQVQARWESTTGSTQVVIADSMGLLPRPYQVLLDGTLILTGTTTGNGLAVYSYTVPLRAQLAHNLTTLPTGGLPATSRGTILPCTLSFADVPSDHPFYPYVRWLACYGYISGYQCGGPAEPCDPGNTPYFRPGNPITRGQLMKMVVNAARWDLATPPSPTFGDVPATHPFYIFIETGSSHGLISGYACGGDGEPCDPQNRAYFRPGADITRGQLSKVIALARAYTLGYPPAPTFADVPTSQPFYLYVEALARNQIISGYTCGGPGEPCDPQQRPYFRPGNGATRAQVAKFVAVAYGGP